jgi:hypothetical protein
MDDIRSVLDRFRSKDAPKHSSEGPEGKSDPEWPSFSEIPDLFFDEILHQFKLSRTEVLVLLYLYRQVWCRPNLFKIHGIGPLQSYQEMSVMTHLNVDDLLGTLKRLEELGFIQTVRAGQYFVRKYFLADFDTKYGIVYDF